MRQRGFIGSKPVAPKRLRVLLGYPLSLSPSPFLRFFLFLFRAGTRLLAVRQQHARVNVFVRARAPEPFGPCPRPFARGPAIPLANCSTRALPHHRRRYSRRVASFASDRRFITVLPGNRIVPFGDDFPRPVICCFAPDISNTADLPTGHRLNSAFLSPDGKRPLPCRALLRGRTAARTRAATRLPVIGRFRARETVGTFHFSSRRRLGLFVLHGSVSLFGASVAECWHCIRLIANDCRCFGEISFSRCMVLSCRCCSSFLWDIFERYCVFLMIV